MTPTTQLAPVVVLVLDVHEVGPVGEGPHERNWEPVARRLAQSSLVFHVMRQVGERVALCNAALVGDGFIPTGKGHRLEREEADLFGIIESELNDAPDLLVVNAVDDGDHRHDLDSGLVEVIDRLQLHVEQVAHLAVRVGGIADSVKLQIGITHAGVGCLLRELQALGEFNSIGRRLHAVVSDFAGIAHRVQEVGRKRGLTARELHRHLPPGLDGDGVVEHGLDVFPAQLVHEADLVSVHEAGIAHHVAAIGEVNGKHRTAAVLHGTGTVIVELLVVVRADVTAGENLFQVAREVRVN